MALLDTIGNLFTKALPWVSAGVGLLSAVKSYDAAGQVEKQGRINAQIERSDAVAYWRSYEDRAAIMRNEQRRFTATQRTNYAKSGVVFEGTPMEVLNDISYHQTLDLQAMRSEADANWRKAQTSANVTEWQCYQQGSATRTQALSNFGSTLLTSQLSYGKPWKSSDTAKVKKAAAAPASTPRYTRQQANAVPGGRGWRPVRGMS